MGSDRSHQDHQPGVKKGAANVRSKSIDDALAIPKRRLIRRSNRVKAPILPPPESVLRQQETEEAAVTLDADTKPSKTVPQEDLIEEKSGAQDEAGGQAQVELSETAEVTPEPDAKDEEPIKTTKPTSNIEERLEEVATEELLPVSSEIIIPDFDESLIDRVGVEQTGLNNPLSFRFYEELFHEWAELVASIQEINPQLRVARIARVGVLVWLKLDPVLRKLISILGPKIKPVDYLEIELLNNLARIYNLQNALPKNMRRFAAKETSVGLSDSEVNKLIDLQQYANKACKFIPSPHKQLLKTAQLRMAMWIMLSTKIDWRQLVDPETNSIESVAQFKEDFEERAASLILSQLNQKAMSR